jgi:transposase
MSFGNPKKKAHKIHMNEGQHKDIKNMFIGSIFFEKQKNPFQKYF